MVSVLTFTSSGIRVVLLLRILIFVVGMWVVERAALDNGKSMGVWVMRRAGWRWTFGGLECFVACI